MDLRAFGYLWELGDGIVDRGVTGTSHGLQTATLVAADGADDPWVFTALVHDIAKPLHMRDHGWVAAMCFDRLPTECRHALIGHSYAVAWVRGEVQRPASLSAPAEQLAVCDAAAFSTLPPQRLLPDFLGLVEAFT